MNTSKGKARKGSREIVHDDELLHSMLGLFTWQTWKLHAALRKRLMEADPQGARMVDELVSDFYKIWMIQAKTEGLTLEQLIDQLSDGQRALGNPLPDVECYEIMRAKVTPLP